MAIDEDVIEKLEKQKRLTVIINLFLVIIYLYMVLSMFSSLTGISISQLLHRISQHKLVLPPHWVQKYSYELYLMQWAAFILILVDFPIAMYFRDEEGAIKAPPVYVFALSFVYTVIGLVLFSAYGYTFDFMLFFFGVLSLVRCVRTKLKSVKDTVETDLYEERPQKEG